MNLIFHSNIAGNPLKKFTPNKNNPDKLPFPYLVTMLVFYLVAMICSVILWTSPQSAIALYWG